MSKRAGAKKEPTRAEILKAIGITEAEALRYQRLASIPQAEFEKRFREIRDVGGDGLAISAVEDELLAKYYPETRRTRGQRGRSKATLDLIQTCLKIIKERQPISVRGVCYALFVDGQIDSMAKENTQKISRVLTEMREEGILPWEWIVDDSRSMEGDGGFTDLKQYARVIRNSYTRDFWAHQTKRVIVISEKATVAGIVRPVLDKYGVPFFAAHGYNSATKVYDLASEIVKDKRTYHFLYIGDYDPSGMHMSEIDLPTRLERYGNIAMEQQEIIDRELDFHFDRIALIESDTTKLPSFDAETKKEDKRYRWFIDNFGAQAWELDAMNPNDLRARVEAEIVDHVDSEAWAQHQKVEEAQQESVRAIADKMAEAIA
jgi:hypothetical protein